MNNRLVTMLVAALVVAGCIKGDQAGGGAGGQAPAAAPVTGADAVAAVLQSPPGTSIAKLGFAVTAKPAVGVQTILRLDISAAAPVPTLVLVAESEGVTIDPATARVNLALPTADKVATHAVRFTSLREGLAEITVRLSDGGADSPQTIYAIPVLVAGPAASN